MENAWWDVAACQKEWAWFMPQATPVIKDMVAQDQWGMIFCAEEIQVCH